MSERDRTPEETDGPELVVQPEDVVPAAVDAGTEDADEGPVRRPLIRATLTLPAGAPATPREPPVFTMHQQQGRGPAARPANRKGRFVRDGGHSNSLTPNKGKKRGRSTSNRGGSSQQSGNRKWASHSDRQGEHHADSGNRSPLSRRDRGRKR